MILKGFEIFNFRSIIDSTWIETEDVTALVGTNESGKTNVLLPLWKLNPVRSGEIDILADMPRSKYSIMKDSPSSYIFIKAQYLLNDSEKEELIKIVEGEPSESFNSIIVSRDYSGNLYFEFPNQKYHDTSEEKITNQIDEIQKKIDILMKDDENPIKISDLDIKKNDLSKFRSEALISNLEKYINENKKLNSNIIDLIQELKNQVISIQNEVVTHNLSKNKDIIAWLTSNMPKYVYYSNYGNLDSRINLKEIIPKLNNSKGADENTKAKIRTLETLFEFVKLSPQEIYDLGHNENSQTFMHDKDERLALLESASVDLTKKFQEWWKQGNYIFELRADSDYFKITVSDSLRPEKINLEARSTGLQWFFSFFLVFLTESERDNKNSILLLDEPGVTLHPSAQKDLFKFFTNLSLKNQLIYTTHSPFMVNSNDLEQVRSVYINKKGESVVSSNLRASEREYSKDQTKSIFSVHAALGLTISDTLLINCNPILVEGPSDQIYFSAIKNLMISKGEIHPLKEIIFIPTGGTKGIKTTSSIVSAKVDNLPFVILDGDESGRNKKKDLERTLYSTQKSKVIDVSDFSFKNGEVEDLFPAKELAELADKIFFRKEDLENDFADQLQPNEPFVNQIEKFAQENSIELLSKNEWKIRLSEEVKKNILKKKSILTLKTSKEYIKLCRLFKILAGEV